VVDGIGGSQIWFEEDEEEDCHEECNGEGDDEETVLLDQNEEGRGRSMKNTLTCIGVK
jgi:hypothetical protein